MAGNEKLNPRIVQMEEKGEIKTLTKQRNKPVFERKAGKLQQGFFTTGSQWSPFLSPPSAYVK